MFILKSAISNSTNFSTLISTLAILNTGTFQFSFSHASDQEEADPELTKGPGITSVSTSHLMIDFGNVLSDA